MAMTRTFTACHCQWCSFGPSHGISTTALPAAASGGWWHTSAVAICKFPFLPYAGSYLLASVVATEFVNPGTSSGIQIIPINVPSIPCPTPRTSALSLFLRMPQLYIVIDISITSVVISCQSDYHAIASDECRGVGYSRD